MVEEFRVRVSERDEDYAYYVVLPIMLSWPGWQTDCHC